MVNVFVINLLSCLRLFFILENALAFSRFCVVLLLLLKWVNIRSFWVSWVIRSMLSRSVTVFTIVMMLKCFWDIWFRISYMCVIMKVMLLFSWTFCFRILIWHISIKSFFKMWIVILLANVIIVFMRDIVRNNLVVCLNCLMMLDWLWQRIRLLCMFLVDMLVLWLYVVVILLRGKKVLLRMVKVWYRNIRIIVFLEMILCNLPFVIR